MSEKEPSFAFPLGATEVRYLTKAIRYRLGKRQTPPSGYNTAAISAERRAELDHLADWMLRG